MNKQEAHQILDAREIYNCISQAIGLGEMYNKKSVLLAAVWIENDILSANSIAEADALRSIAEYLRRCTVETNKEVDNEF